MSQMIVTHGVVKKLTKNIRGAFNREDIRSTDVLALIADAFGRKPDAMMHFLKNQKSDREDEASHTPVLSATSGSATILSKLGRAIHKSQPDEVLVYAELLARDNALNTLMIGLGYRFLSMNPKTDTGVPYGRIILDAFEQDEAAVRMVATTIGMEFPTVNDAWAVGMPVEQAEWTLRSFSYLEREDLLTYGLGSAVKNGFLKFDGDKPVLVRPEAEAEDAALTRP